MQLYKRPKVFSPIYCYELIFAKQENLQRGRKSMAKNFMRKLMAVMIDLVIFMLLEVQPTNLISTSFHHSSFPIAFSDPFESFSFCLESKFEQCKQLLEEEGALRKHSFCIINGFRRCKLVEHPHDPMRQKYIDAEALCLKKYIKRKRLLAHRDCLVKWYHKTFINELRENPNS